MSYGNRTLPGSRESEDEFRSGNEVRSGNSTGLQGIIGD